MSIPRRLLNMQPMETLRFRRRMESSAAEREEEEQREKEKVWERVAGEIEAIVKDDPALANPNLNTLEYALNVLDTVDADERLDKVRREKPCISNRMVAVIYGHQYVYIVYSITVNFCSCM